MIECIFTIDYEIYGNGDGSLKDLVYEPAEMLKKIFLQWNVRFVNFIEVAEFEMIESVGSDPAINLVKQQIRDFHEEGFELGLHLHPQWYNGRYENEKWELDYSEYNLCTLPRERIEQIVDRSIRYLQAVTGESDYKPLSFRAGNWLFQPTATAAEILADRGIKIDSSVFKGGLQRHNNLDYRRALKNGYFWNFSDHVDIPDDNGKFLEMPIFTQMVPIWKMLTPKRVGLQKKGSTGGRSKQNKLYRLWDTLRLYHPLKFDFCRMTLTELTTMMEQIIQEDRLSPEEFKPIVAIGHTKDLVDFKTVDNFLNYLREKQIPVSTFAMVFHKLKSMEPKSFQ